MKRSDFRKPYLIKFPSKALMDSFDKELCKYYEKRPPKDTPILLDFCDTIYIDLALLINLIALSCSRAADNADTYIGISKYKSVRDFLRVWQFSKAFHEATSISFKDVLVEDDHKYWGEPQTTYTGEGDAISKLEYSSDWKPGKRAKRNFFEFSSEKLINKDNKSNGDRDIYVPRQEGNRWNDPLIKTVLKKHLSSSSSENEVARVIIYESLSNAVRHPEATIIQAVSQFQRKHENSKGRSGHLRICIWDDGKSIVDTLKPIIEKGLPIRSTGFPRYMYDSIYFQSREYGETFRRGKVIHQGEDPPLTASSELILLSSLFPGVTRTIVNPVKEVKSFEDENDESDVLQQELAKQGMGLYALTRVVLNMYQGAILIRSGNHFLSMEVAHDTYRKPHKVQYKSRVTIYPKYLPPFKGNLLIIQLPLK